MSEYLVPEVFQFVQFWIRVLAKFALIEKNRFLPLCRIKGTPTKLIYTRLPPDCSLYEGQGRWPAPPASQRLWQPSLFFNTHSSCGWEVSVFVLMNLCSAITLATIIKSDAPKEKKQILWDHPCSSTLTPPMDEKSVYLLNILVPLLLQQQ